MVKKHFTIDWVASVSFDQFELRAHFLLNISSFTDDCLQIFIELYFGVSNRKIWTNSLMPFLVSQHFCPFFAAFIMFVILFSHKIAESWQCASHLQENKRENSIESETFLLQNSSEPITASMDDFILCLLLWLPPTICSNQVNETSERKRAEITALMTGGMQCARASPGTSARQNVQKRQKYIKSVKISIQYYLTVTIFSSYHLTNDETCLNVVANIQSNFNFLSFLHRLSYTYARHDIMKWKKHFGASNLRCAHFREQLVNRSARKLINNKLQSNMGDN